MINKVLKLTSCDGWVKAQKILFDARPGLHIDLARLEPTTSAAP